MILKLTVLIIAANFAACTALPDRVNPYESQDALIIEHKLLINDSDAAREQASNDYYASTQYLNARHANEFLKANRKELSE